MTDRSSSGSRGAGGGGAHALAPGARVGEWQVVESLGRGAVGAVYRARAVDRDQEVALKVLSGELDPARRARFAREGQLTARLRHEGVVAVHGALEVEGRPCLVYELVEGRPLTEMLDSLDRPARLEVLRRVAHAVAHAHAHGVVHRDLKPDNVVLDGQGRPKVIDFGLARAADLERLTRTHAVLGTPSHMAPEQLEGGDGVGPPADVWALGVMLYRALLDRMPFEAESLVELAEQVDAGLRVGPRRQDPSISPDLDAVVQRALARRPEHRYADAGALADDLDRVVLRGEPTRARSAARRRQATVLLAAGAGASVALALAALAVAARQAQTGGERPTEQAEAAPLTTATVVREVDDAGAPTATSDSEPKPRPATSRLEALRAGAERGDASSMLDLGLALRRGEGGALDLAAGEAWLRRAADAGHEAAQRELAGLVAIGAVEGDPRAALASLERLGDARAAFLAGRARRYGPAAIRDDRAAFAMFMKAATAGEPDGMVAVARELFRGRGELLADRREAVEWLERAAALEHGPALFELGNLVAVGQAGPRDLVRAHDLHARARAALVAGAARHEGEPATLLGLLLRDGQGGPIDLPGAARLMRAAVGAGVGPLAHHSLGALLAEAPELASDPDEARRELEQAMTAGWPQAAWLLYGLYRDGRLAHDEAQVWTCLLAAAGGVPDAGPELARRAREHPDPTDLRTRLEQALASGQGAAAYPLAILVDEGRGGPPDPDEADRLLRRAVESGLPAARFDLAFRLWPREDPAAVTEAVALFKRMAEGGATAGMHYLGVARERGRGAPQDLGEAVRWYEHAFARGNAWAGVDLARMRHEGRGCDRDDAAALAILDRAVPMLERSLESDNANAVGALVTAARLGQAVASVRADVALEVRFLRLGARLDDPDSLVALGLRLAEGRDVRRDALEAARLLERAAAAGRADAAEALARLRASAD